MSGGTVFAVQTTFTVSAGNPARVRWDGFHRVKGTVNGATTVYIGNTFEWSGSTSTIKKYYYASGLRVAMREGSSDPKWLLADHLGSSTITASFTGSRLAELAYKAWGENRYTYGTTPTTYRFTGQRIEVSIGIYFYGARWYDSSQSRFAQADTIIPGAGNPKAWDRFAYALNSPVIFIDPSGHAAGTPTCNYDPDFTGSLLFGIRFKDGSKKWNLRGMLAILEGVRAAAKRYEEITHGRASDAFRAVHNTSTTNPLVFEMGCPECSRLGFAVNSHLIKVRDFYSAAYADKALRDRNMITHELGHAFNAQMVNDLGASLSPSQVLNRRQSTDLKYPNRQDVTDLPYGFASVSGVFTWQQSTDPSYSEEFADQFLGWTYDTWQSGPFGQARATFMNINMYLWVSATGY